MRPMGWISFRAGCWIMSLRFIDFACLTVAQRTDCVRILRDGFTHQPAAFSEPGEAEDEVDSFFTVPERWAIAAVEGEAVVGWIGTIETYEAGWEMHPLVVDPAHQRRGLGGLLLAELEARVKARGILVLYLGTDDDFGGTSLSGADLFPDVAGKIAAMRETNGHPFAFYRKQGYEVVGLLPDVNGFGKPDIWMAKRLQPPPQT